ncbi:phage integrase SAM-like domain-containing protein [Maribacter algicola]|uniref:phage integrase SAM-like domain-containing protein n=1 Tax=Maribacter algicola TaxID=2498892 RepID=UPI001401BBBF|nr:phage integrase SAM-like domain-containing protein [Maribacter algicola]
MADKIRANRELEILSDKTGHVTQHLKNQNFNLFAEHYIKTHKFKDIRIVASAVEKFKLTIDNPRLKISKINPTIMETFKDYLLHDAGLAGETAHNYFIRFKKVLKSAKIQGYLKFMPTDDIQFSNPNKDDSLRKQVLDAEEL